MNGFGVIIYSGSTADRFVSINLDTEDIISDIKVEREYGSYVKDIETYDKNHAVITYSGAMNVSTMIIDDEGNLTVKRYDGEVFRVVSKVQFEDRSIALLICEALQKVRGRLSFAFVRKTDSF